MNALKINIIKLFFFFFHSETLELIIIYASILAMQLHVKSPTKNLKLLNLVANLFNTINPKNIPKVIILVNNTETEPTLKFIVESITKLIKFYIKNKSISLFRKPLLL
jgi:hypothetical protein